MILKFGAFNGQLIRRPLGECEASRLTIRVTCPAETTQDPGWQGFFAAPSRRRERSDSLVKIEFAPMHSKHHFTH
jgi:hypothetical protein